jgi:OOP family OmpA-OmpF porin
MKVFFLIALSGLASLHGYSQTMLKRCVYFDTDKAEIREDGLQTLDKLVDTLTTVGAFKILIRGNTDAVGDSLYNIQLSEKRSQAVYDYLRSKKMCGCKLKIESNGENKPVADNESDTGKQRNRRVEIYVNFVPKKTLAYKP